MVKSARSLLATLVAQEHRDSLRSSRTRLATLVALPTPLSPLAFRPPPPGLPGAGGGAVGAVPSLPRAARRSSVPSAAASRRTPPLKVMLRVSPPPPAVPAARRRSTLLRWPPAPAAARRWRRFVCGGCRGHLAARAVALVPPAPRTSPLAPSAAPAGGRGRRRVRAGLGRRGSFLLAFGFLFPFFSPPAPAVFGVFGPRPPFRAGRPLRPGPPLRLVSACWSVCCSGCRRGGAAPPGAGRLTRCRAFGFRGSDRLDS